MTSHFPQYVLVLIFIVILYFPTSWVMSGISGWHRLAASYRNDSPFHPDDWMICRARFRAALPFDSKLSLRVGADRQYLYLRTWPFNFPGYPELRVPWPQVSVAGGKHGFWRQCELSLRDCSGVRFRVPSATMERAVNQAGGQWNDGQPQFPV